MELCRIGAGPGSSHWSIAKVGADLAIDRVAERDHEIHAWRIGTHELVPRFRAQTANVVTKNLKAIKHLRHRRWSRRIASRIGLETALTNYVESGTPPGDVPAAMNPQAPDTTAHAASAAPGPAEAAEAQAAAERDAAGIGPTARPATGPESLLNRFAAPLALILGILSLVLYIMLRVTLGQWRRQQRRETLEAKHAATIAQAAAAETSAAVADSVARVKRAEALVLAAAPDASAAAPAPDRLSSAQRLEVERLVSQRVDEELRWLRANLPELVAAVVAQPSSVIEAEEPTAASDANAAGPEATKPIADDVQLD